ncbi:hypothetical protein OH807_02605 [Kitasatospora sp. NBC_01560]|uniref:hypothetical protein n=1 Tax=Kitasatospora sp. NBC_01560 TaxID=2975965 RepID=UPI003864F30E
MDDDGRADRTGDRTGDGRPEHRWLEIRFDGLTHSAGPATWGQRTIWAPISWYAPDDHYFNIALPVELRRPVGPAAFGSAVRALLERHDSLRTVYRTTADGGLEQVLRGAGTLRVRPVEPVADEPLATALERVAAEDRAVRFHLLAAPACGCPRAVCPDPACPDPACGDTACPDASCPSRAGAAATDREGLPVRVSAVLVDGLVAGAVVTVAHIAADGTGAQVIRDDLRRLLAQQHRRPGTLPPPVPGRRPMEQAAYEAGAQATARSAAAVALWGRQLAGIPASLWPEVAVTEPVATEPVATDRTVTDHATTDRIVTDRTGGPGGGTEEVERWWEGLLVCPRLDRASRVAAVRTGTSAGAVVLAAVGLELGARTGATAVPLKVILGNRVSEEQRTAVGAFAQNGLVVLAATGDFEEAARQAWRSQLQTSRHGHYDPGALAAAVLAEEKRRGTAMDLNALFNDHREPERPAGGGPAPEPVAPGALPAGRFEWRSRWARQDSKFFFGLAHRDGEAVASLLVDTRHFPAAEVEPFLRAVEDRVTAAAED